MCSVLASVVAGRRLRNPLIYWFGVSQEFYVRNSASAEISRAIRSLRLPAVGHLALELQAGARLAAAVDLEVRLVACYNQPPALVQVVLVEQLPLVLRLLWSLQPEAVVAGAQLAGALPVLLL